MSAPDRYAPPTPRRTAFVHSADGTRIAYEEHGPQDAPTIVLSHGWTCSTVFWAAVIRELAPDWRVVAYDQRGHGRSGTPRGRSGYSTDALADDLEAVLCAALPDGAPALLAGHSMGGMTLMAAADRPAVRARTAAVLLASTGSGRLVDATLVLPARVRSPRIRRAFHRALLHSSAPLGPQGPLLRAALKYGVMAPGSTPAQVAAVTRIVAACGRRQRAGWGRVLAGLNLDAGVTALRAPTAVLVGTADKLTPRTHAHGMAARLPHGLGVTELPGLGHMTPIEDPDAVVRVLRDLARQYLKPRHEIAKEGESA
ncbi:alpha/beta fold hydrolase [Streptantibioticus silvisoli]|uniref:Alpha/beta fold hydrolase n=1 Tax=Streptantibioticus silvisoli TaxID=2705255 RepID=A0ABT6W5Y3_9ACTN|nr:alpha/beta fold hydrolase [Streptantibioticus silvisoli]MDI5966163.1 alpha/beta fold hydrolase [Streptantibioticus silvisoli]